MYIKAQLPICRYSSETFVSRQRHKPLRSSHSPTCTRQVRDLQKLKQNRDETLGMSQDGLEIENSRPRRHHDMLVILAKPKKGPRHGGVQFLLLVVSSLS
jgi:hypothetical protein